ncbi:MAG: Na+/H+ antiporter subunit E [Defluviitaleaceae bacterium]|nr:Na+/H+ antiporter subunit E [Defluviitaleaceae bacterium]MCL2273774.1 Na+/H+ antiporter subunit E [Defluviitaleaceae bacterium]
MRKRVLFIVPALTIIWVILAEDISVIGVLVGLFVSIGVVYVTSEFLPPQRITNIDFKRLVTFPLYLIGQIYVAGFHIMWTVVRGAKVNIVTVKTEIKSEALRVVLVDSITLTPGSILLDLDDDKVTLLWIRGKDTPPDPAIADEQLKKKLERRLLKAQTEDV